MTPPGYRLPAATHVGRVRLQVSDLDRSLDWYTRVLGFEAEAEGGTAALSAGGRPLIELVERPGVRSVRGRPRLGLYHFAVLLPDRPSLGRFLAHARSLDEPLGAADHLVSEALYLHDPDGLGVEVYADRPREAWRMQGTELQMTTEPLDLPSVVDAGGGRAWTGMPEGTTIGHVHLHVGDLERATGFYHEGIGLDKMVWSYPGALFLSAGGYHHHLGVNTWAGAAPPAGPDDARLLEWELIVPGPGDAEAVLDNLERLGHDVVGADAEAGDAAGGMTPAAAGSTASADRSEAGGIARDPWGTAVRVRPVPPAATGA